MADTSNLAAIRAAIVAMIEGVSGVGTVHARSRVTHDWGDFIAQFVDSNNIVNGWTVMSTAVEEERLTNRSLVIRHEFTLRHYRGVDDANASEVSFDNHVEAVRDDFRESYDLSATCELHTPLTVPIKDIRMFGSVLCHYAEGKIVCQERLAGGVA